MIREGLKRSLCLQRRGFSGSVGSGPPSNKQAVEAYDESKYGGWKSATILFAEEPNRKPLVGRWDWHVVQFLLAMIPPGLAFLMVQWARYDMRKVEARREKEALAKESEKLATVMAHQQQTSATGQPTGSPQAAAAAQQTAGGGGQDVQVRLSRLEALVQQLVEQQAAREDARLEQEALQRQQSAAAPETAARSSAVGQQAGQQQLQAAVERQPEQPVAESPHAVQHPAEQPAQDVQQGLRSLLQRVQPAWGWVRGRLAGAAAKVASPPGASSQAGSRAEAGQPGHGDGKSASSVQGGALQKEDGGVSEGGGPAQAASGMPLALPAAARAPGGGTRGAAEAQAARGPAPPATAAQWLLHSVGAPLRWLRQRDAGPPS